MGSHVAAMEILEEQNRMKFLKLGEEDRISALPDCLLHEILSRLRSTKYAIRTGVLSKRWEHLWTSVTTLIFTHSDHFLTQCRQNPDSTADFVSFVDKALTQCRQLKLKKFVQYSHYDIRFGTQFNDWIRYALSCNVEELYFGFWFGSKTRFALDQFFFTGSCFTDVRLERCILDPSVAISWKNLRSLKISNVKLDEDLIENILSGSPLLETLELRDCYGYGRLNITSKSVKNFVLSGYDYPEYPESEDEYYRDDIVVINAPNILSLTIEESFVLLKLLLENVSSVVEANLDYDKLGRFETTRKETEDETLKGFILKLRHAKELTIGSSCSKVVTRLKAKGFNFPSNIKLPDATFDSSDSD